MQAFGNLASPILRKTSKAGKAYSEFRLAESQRSQPGSASEEPTWYTIRVMQGNVPEFAKGDFIRVTGKLKCDYYLSREGKPTGNLLIIAFEACKISKHATEPGDTAKISLKAIEPENVAMRAPVPVSESGQLHIPESAQRHAPAQLTQAERSPDPLRMVEWSWSD